MRPDASTRCLDARRPGFPAGKKSPNSSQEASNDWIPREPQRLLFARVRARRRPHRRRVGFGRPRPCPRLRAPRSRAAATTPDAARTECATADLPSTTTIPRREVHIAVARIPAAGPARRLALLQLRRPRRRGRRLPPGGRREPATGPRSTSTSTSSASTRAASARARPPSTATSNQEKLGIYSQPFTTPFNLDVNALLRRTGATSGPA